MQKYPRMSRLLAKTTGSMRINMTRPIRFKGNPSGNQKTRNYKYFIPKIG